MLYVFILIVYIDVVFYVGNASIASKITEISDVGRTASQHMSASAVASNAAVASAQAAAAAAVAQAALADKKRRRIESATNTMRTVRDSTCSVVPGMKRQASGPLAAAAATRAAAMAGNKRKADSDVSMNSLQTEVPEENNDAELNQLRQELIELREMNAQLMYNQINRETEIRIEVSQEMAKRSQHLLEQIHSLQMQLSERNNTTTIDITRSVKKQRRQQMKTIAEEQSGRDIQEVEEELERVKSTYEQELLLLRSQNRALANAVEKLQGTTTVGGPAGIMPPTSISTKMASQFNNLSAIVTGAVSSSSSSSLQQNLDSSSAQVAAEFSKRFSKKNDENCINTVNIESSSCTTEKNNSSNSPLKKSPLSKSPNRSPLSEVRNAGNSPVLKSYQSGTVSAAAKRIDSPQRMRDENTNANSTNNAYGTRLRGQQLRA